MLDFLFYSIARRPRATRSNPLLPYTQLVRSLAVFAGNSGSETTFRGQVAAAIQLLGHVSRLKDGKRRVMSITEVVGLVDGELVLRDVFRYDLERGEHLDLRGVMP